MKKQFIWKGHEVKIVNTQVDDDNRKKGVIEGIIKRCQHHFKMAVLPSFFLMAAGSIVFIVFNASCFQPQIAV